MNVLLFVTCFNYTFALCCSMWCVIVPLHQYDDDDDDAENCHPLAKTKLHSWQQRDMCALNNLLRVVM